MSGKSRRYKARATIICLRSGKILLVRKKGGKWNFPGGTVEDGEQPVQAAARELEEETRLRCLGLLQLCSVEVGNTVHHVFTTQFDDYAEAIAANEIAACKWVRREQLDSTALTPSALALMLRRLPALCAS
ncbi:NUDIX domain-containing protein [Pseudomonas sp. 148P]|uniref:NUDIX domain-containing protein n=1 Tax=Pseudomonas ulcerans TaxID=3115852 RepID=A0ABU7I0X1_9PSED|nr:MULTISPECIES: NUDIX domain-containing protein [unclassified Pseudomonas]MEE1926137.1 NUDIX domain-containing protein [Pseudomonas sp. 147P]MEE1937444.1 NUDIX domain-containing protein [Pseudomonas sp. 148P]